MFSRTHKLAGFIIKVCIYMRTCIVQLIWDYTFECMCVHVCCISTPCVVCVPHVLNRGFIYNSTYLYAYVYCTTHLGLCFEFTVVLNLDALSSVQFIVLLFSLTPKVTVLLLSL